VNLKADIYEESSEGVAYSRKHLLNKYDSELCLVLGNELLVLDKLEDGTYTEMYFHRCESNAGDWIGTQEPSVDMMLIGDFEIEWLNMMLHHKNNPPQKRLATPDDIRHADRVHTQFIDVVPAPAYGRVEFLGNVK